MIARIRGRAWRFGDDVNTDVILPGRYLGLRDPVKLAPHIMEGVDPEFTTKAKPGDLIVAGTNFGCGSSREAAPAAIKAFGVGCVIAASFARIFLRNAINIGLPILESAAAAQGIGVGEEIEVDLEGGRITNVTRGETFEAAPFPPFLRELMAAGGLVAYARRRLGRPSSPSAGVGPMAPPNSAKP